MLAHGGNDGRRRAVKIAVEPDGAAVLNPLCQLCRIGMAVLEKDGYTVEPVKYVKDY